MIIQGCAIISCLKKFIPPIAIGSVVYIIEPAFRGITEKVTIKKANLIDYEGTVPIFNYVDTFNRVWLAQEFGTLSYIQSILAIYEVRAERGRSQICLNNPPVECNVVIIGNP